MSTDFSAIATAISIIFTIIFIRRRDLGELRPRRWYPDKLGKMARAFTRYPNDVGDAWKKLLPFEEFE
jgi:hypothetical protein